MMKKKRTLEEQLYLYGIAALVIGVLGIWLYSKLYYPLFKDTGCVFHNVTGVYCPGCGGTRATLELLHGHFLRSLWYHPLVLYAGMIYSGFMLSHTCARLHLFHAKGWKFHNWYLYVAVGIVLVNWILKNVLQFQFQIIMV